MIARCVCNFGATTIDSYSDVNGPIFEYFNGPRLSLHAHRRDAYKIINVRDIYNGAGRNVVDRQPRQI
jgi:hypothetical protein